MWKAYKATRHRVSDKDARPFDIAFFDERNYFVRGYPGSFATMEAAEKKAAKMNKEGRQP